MPGRALRAAPPDRDQRTLPVAAIGINRPGRRRPALRAPSPR